MTIQEKLTLFTPLRLPAWARIRIAFADGTSHNFSVWSGPFGLVPSPTKAGTAVRRLLVRKKSCP